MDGSRLIPEHNIAQSPVRLEAPVSLCDLTLGIDQWKTCALPGPTVIGLSAVEEAAGRRACRKRADVLEIRTPQLSLVVRKASTR
jgi:hypothetical protein